MRAVDLIALKREGGRLESKEIRFLINGYVDGSVPDYQMSAFLMAVYFKGLDPVETGFLTRAMIDSGDVIDLSGLSGPLIDKHSTGGVGDKVSLILAPVAAACGLQVPMMSGRALGHTGGTLDKLESIPGYRTDVDQHRFIEIIEQAGYAMTGQSETIVPADRKMYALRDVTATVESIPLITASILSKKFAEGAEGLVFDVKAGSGAFMKTQGDARALADSLYNTGKQLDRRVTSVITAMEQPLGRAVGNFLEVAESVDVLRGRGPADLVTVTVNLVAHMLCLGRVVDSLQAGLKKAQQALDSGDAWERFKTNIELQGGDVRAVESPATMTPSPLVESMLASGSGNVVALDAFHVGMASVLLGAGRSRQNDAVLPDVGVELTKKIGDTVETGEELCRVHARTPAQRDQAIRCLEEAYRVGPESTVTGDLILEVIGD